MTAADLLTENVPELFFGFLLDSGGGGMMGGLEDLGLVTGDGKDLGLGTGDGGPPLTAVLGEVELVTGVSSDFGLGTGDGGLPLAVSLGVFITSAFDCGASGCLIGGPLTLCGNGEGLARAGCTGCWETTGRGTAVVD